jgi:two-component system, NarL family, invasion response regulator UvrY
MDAIPPEEDTPIVTTDTVRVLIVDDQLPFRTIARTVVGVTEAFTVVAEAASGEQAVEVAGQVEPDFVLMDINLPGINGVEATRQILANRPDTLVILLSTYQVDDLPDGAESCGAAAYVHKEDFSSALLASLWRDHREPPGSPAGESA